MITGAAHIIASTPASSKSFKYSTNPSIFSLWGIIFVVTYNFLFKLCAKSQASFIWGISKLEARALKENFFPPINTASAPYIKAIFSFSKSPAGASNSGFII